MHLVLARRHLLAKISDEIELTREEIRLQAAFAELMREIREGRAEQREARAEQRAQTQALLNLIDRMDRLDPGGAAT
jgi:hypothetical protein